ncbi:Snl1 protein [Maudiozyma humilis]|uniref:Snl1 protein n=1 Tax=Maudiozyma humilis TaxID=51915 RepID=A0AAV5RVQ3_MAUHU|nr:Snl1 protein [Kazachstania humilis]
MDAETISKFVEEHVSGDAMGAISIFLAVATMFLWQYVAKNKAIEAGKKIDERRRENERPVVPMDPAAKLENVYLRYENEFKDRVAKITDLFSPDDEKDVYERNYCNEMLLKLMIELDNVDLTTLPGSQKKKLRLRRKEILKIIQEELVRLDALK